MRRYHGLPHRGGDGKPMFLLGSRRCRVHRCLDRRYLVRRYLVHRYLVHRYQCWRRYQNYYFAVVNPLFRVQSHPGCFLLSVHQTVVLCGSI